MADIFSQARRSEVMALIRGSGNQATELRMIALFRAHGITGWRRRQAVFGKPDFVFRKERLAVFVDGCFWHSCPRHCRVPAGNREFWEAKLVRNKSRDQLVSRTLRAAGWRVLRVWECELAAKNWCKVAGKLKKLKGRN